MPEVTEVPVEDVPMPGDTETRQEIVQRNSVNQYAVDVMPLMTDGEISRAWRTANALAKSRMFKNVTQAEQAFAKILLGRDLGLSPTQAMQGLYIVEGNLQIAGAMLGSFIKRRRVEGYNYKVLERTHEKARVQFITPDWDPEVEEPQVAEFTAEDASRAGLMSKPTYQKHPRNMLFWRAMSDGVKAFCPEIMGGIPVYTEGELDDLRPAATATQAASGNTGPALPEHVQALVERAAALDAGAWREQEVAARLPLPGDEGYDAAVGRLAEELTTWLDEHEPADAEVVPEDDSSGVETVDVAADLQKRWDAEEEWRGQVGPLLHRYADMEASLDEAVASGDDTEAENLRVELDQVEDALDALGVPVGWVPTSGDADSQF